MKLLADSSVDQIFGTIAPPQGVGDLGKDPVQGVGKLLTTGLQIVFLVAGLMTLFYLLWGAFDWVTSNGEKEALSKAQKKMTSAVVGLILLVAAFTIFVVVTQTILGGKLGIGPGFTIIIPKISTP